MDERIHFSGDDGSGQACIPHHRSQLGTVCPCSPPESPSFLPCLNCKPKERKERKKEWQGRKSEAECGNTF